jgi:hypothetical protein
MHTIDCAMREPGERNEDQPVSNEPRDEEMRHEAGGELPTRGGLDQLREILFGAVRRDLERRLGRADSRLTVRSSELQRELRRRTDVLEAHIHRELQEIAAHLEREVIDAQDATRILGREHRDITSALQQRVTKLEEALTREHKELREELLGQAKSFLDELLALRRDFAQTLERELGISEGALTEEQGGAAGESATH